MHGIGTRGSGRWAATMAGGVLAVASLAGCAGPAGGEQGAPGGEPGQPGGEASDTGTVTVTFDAGEHAGVYEGEGSLKCSHGDFVPDNWWIVFASSADEPSAQEVNIVNFWQVPEAEVDNPDSPYRGDQYLFDLWLGNPLLDGAKFSVSAADGGTVALDGADGNTVTFSGETVHGEPFSVVAACSRIKTD